MTLFLKRNKTETPPFDEAKSQYEWVIKSCYNFKSVTVALCSFKHFTGFNLERSFERQHVDLVNDYFKIGGVIHEFGPRESDVRCSGDVSDSADPDGHVGGLTLTHMKTNEPKTRHEEQELELHFWLCDPTGKYQTALQSKLRDTALSGYQFTHVELVCEPPTPESLADAMAKMRESGCGPDRKIVSLKMWPSIELPNAPTWARSGD
jgi:hypothetical protein